MWSGKDLPSGSESRLQPLLPANERGGERPSRWQQLARVGLVTLVLTAYIATGALERVSFTRMAAKLPGDLLLVHTLLSALSTTLFIVLWMARAQSN